MKSRIVIIGAGPAGESAARTARQLSAEAEIVLIEKSEAGGLCLNRGCIPSKTLLEQIHQRVLSSDRVDWSQIQETKRKVIFDIRTQLEASIKRRRITLVQGTAAFHGPNAVEVQTKEGLKKFDFDKAIITSGTKSFLPGPLDQFENDIWDSDKMLEISKTPKSIVIVGGGAVGCEFACLLNAVGVNVTIVEMQANLIPGEDTLVTAALARSYEAKGIRILTENRVARIERNGPVWNLELANGEKMTTDEILACVGRTPQPEDLNLEKAGIQMNKHGLVLNEFLQTTNPNVFAAGDVTKQTRLAHAAAHQGQVAAVNAMGGKDLYDGDHVPRCLYSRPEVASIGREKWELDAKNISVKSARAYFKGSSKALASGDTEGFIQILSDPDSGLILGAQIIGPHATELIHVFAVALCKKMTTRELGAVMFAHPTLAESIKEAAAK